MAKFITVYNAGYGDCADIIECENHAEAEQYAYEAWREACEAQADYSAVTLTQESADEYGLDFEGDDE